ncbi:hypothetical protein CHLRE_16g688633v5 [Chlamydomonas reinhardtii]|nr:uncharacterized protein CHLRE_16g688633v5 [Chlamydomonas reinhardtii]PNW71800.1 hypothetical protein CHLRE_16g688633v5 [Chlamydomonas reinhardtii]
MRSALPLPRGPALGASPPKSLVKIVLVRNAILCGPSRCFKESRPEPSAPSDIERRLEAKFEALREDFLARDAALREDFLARDAALREDFLARDAALREDFLAREAVLRAGIAPLQVQYARNVVRQVAKSAVLGKKPSPGSGRTYVDYAMKDPASRARLESVLKVGTAEVMELLADLAGVRNEGEHPPDLESLRRMVSEARRVCGPAPTDPHLIFARRFLDAYEEIEKMFLL